MVASMVRKTYHYRGRRISNLLDPLIKTEQQQKQAFILNPLSAIRLSIMLEHLQAFALGLFRFLVFHSLRCTMDVTTPFFGIEYLSAEK